MPENPGFSSLDEEGKGATNGRPTAGTIHSPSFQKGGRRTKCEKFLIFSVFVCVVVIVVLAVVIGTRKSDDPPTPVEVCTSSDCAEAAARVLASIDETVDPCDNFYQFACGTWKRKNVIPEDKSAQNVFGVLRDDVQVVNKYLLEDKNSHPGFEAVQKAKNLYSSCTDLGKIEELGHNVTLPLLNELGGWPVLGTSPGGNWVEGSFSLVTLLATLRKYSNNPLINYYVTTDVKDSENRIIYMDQPGFGLPGRDYYLEQGERFEAMRQAYVDLASGVAQLFGANQTTAIADMETMLALETDIANITMKAEDRRDNEALYNRITIDKLAVNFTEPGAGDTIQFNWMDYISEIMNLDGVKVSVNTNENVVVRAVPYFGKLFGVLNRYTKRDIANYLVWYIMMNRAGNLPQAFRDLTAKYNEAIYGTTTSRARWRSCVDYTVDNLGMAVGHMFVQETFDESAKAIALDMITNIREAFNELLDELDWMDGPTKVLAREKAEAIREWIGYPDFALDKTKVNEMYANYTVHADKYFDNVLTNLRERSISALRVLREKYDKNLWTSPPSTVNAFYNSVLNTIMFPAGILQPPFYSKSQPRSMNFGGIGMVIGHEITHGFDDRGRQYDKDGNLVQWWSDNIIDAFKTKAQCIVDQYSNFLVKEANMTVNGINTQGENIADNGGLKQSFKAYRKWVASQGSEEPLLPGIQYNHNQLFFINFAQVWCNNIREQAMINSIATGVHSPGEFRVIGSLQNSPDFAAAFNCRNNQYMHPQNKCYVW